MTPIRCIQRKHIAVTKTVSEFIGVIITNFINNIKTISSPNRFVNHFIFYTNLVNF